MPQIGFTTRTRMYYGDYEFAPVPTFGWTTEIIRDGTGSAIYKRHTLDFTGTLLFDSVSESGQLDNMITKQNALRNALGSGNQEWRLTYDGSTLIDGKYPRVQDVAIDEGLWVDKCGYTFSFVYDEDFEDTGIESYSESWEYSESENRRTVTISHDISAKGQNTNPSGTSNALTNAKDYVLAKTGYTNAVSDSPFFCQASGLTTSAYEEGRVESIDVASDTYGVTESFILSSGTFVHTYNTQYSQDENGIVTVTVNGSIKGLGRFGQALVNAKDAWSNEIEAYIPGMASGAYVYYGGASDLYTNNRESFSITENEMAGTIDYSVSYNDDPSENLPDGVREFTITSTINAPLTVYARFLIPNRSAGELFQPVGTKKAGQQTIAGTIIGEPGVEMSVLRRHYQQKMSEKRLNGMSSMITSASSVTEDTDKKTINFSVTYDYNV